VVQLVEDPSLEPDQKLALLAVSAPPRLVERSPLPLDARWRNSAFPDRLGIGNRPGFLSRGRS
jgi:hypothetical protein